MFVVEGPDGAGKTTLVKHLAETYGLTVQPKAVSPDQTVVTSLRRWVDQSIARGWGPWLYDRHALISGPIYYAAMNSRTTSAKPQEGFDDEDWLRKAYSYFWDIRPVVIYCLPPFDAVWDNCQRDEANRRLFPQRDQLGRVYWSYFAKSCEQLNSFKYDYTGEGDRRLIDQFVSAMLLRKV